MSELAPKTTPEQITPDNIDPNIQKILDSHIEEKTGYVEASRDFAVNQLGLVDAIQQDRITVLPHEVKQTWGEDSGGGAYLPEADVVYVFEPEKNGRPKTENLQLAASLVHEITHSALETTETATTIHPFYSEAIAGIAEYLALNNLSASGEFEQAPDTYTTRKVGDRDVKVVIPGGFRRVDAVEVKPGEPESTQALIAAMVVGIGLKISGESVMDILSEVRKGNVSVYNKVREAIAAISPELPGEIESTEQSTNGILMIAEKAQKLVGMQ